MRTKRVLKRKFKYFFTFYFVLLFLIVISSLISFSKYSSIVSSNKASISIAKPIVEMNNDISTADIVDGSKVIKYFTVSNYNVNDTTDVGMDYYIYIVNEYGEVIDNLTLYYQIDEDNPNEFYVVNKITEGEYAGYYQAESFTTTKHQHGYKLVIDEVSNYSQIYVKIVAIQKEVN